MANWLNSFLSWLSVNWLTLSGTLATLFAGAVSIYAADRIATPKVSLVYDMRFNGKPRVKEGILDPISVSVPSPGSDDSVTVTLLNAGRRPLVATAFDSKRAIEVRVPWVGEEERERFNKRYSKKYSNWSLPAKMVDPYHMKIGPGLLNSGDATAFTVETQPRFAGSSEMALTHHLIDVEVRRPRSVADRKYGGLLRAGFGVACIIAFNLIAANEILFVSYWKVWFNVFNFTSWEDAWVSTPVMVVVALVLVSAGVTLFVIANDYSKDEIADDGIQRSIRNKDQRL